jgi:hypothetical protein
MTLDQNLEIIRALQTCRAIQRTLVETKASPEIIRRHVATAIPFLSLIESLTPDHELWTSLPEEAELTARDSVGDHLAVTRRALGLVA